jgi:hypothetical protein
MENRNKYATLVVMVVMEEANHRQYDTTIGVAFRNLQVID